MMRRLSPPTNDAATHASLPTDHAVQLGSASATSAHLANPQDDPQTALPFNVERLDPHPYLNSWRKRRRAAMRGNSFGDEFEQYDPCETKQPNEPDGQVLATAPQAHSDTAEHHAEQDHQRRHRAAQHAMQQIELANDPVGLSASPRHAPSQTDVAEEIRAVDEPHLSSRPNPGSPTTLLDSLRQLRDRLIEDPQSRSVGLFVWRAVQHELAKQTINPTPVSLASVRQQLIEGLAPASTATSAKAQSLHLLMPLILLHAARPRRQAQRHRTQAVLQALTLGTQTNSTEVRRCVSSFAS